LVLCNIAHPDHLSTGGQNTGMTAGVVEVARARPWPQFLWGACVTSPTFGAMDENAVHLGLSDVHQQSSTVPTQKINRVQTGVRNRREVARASESGRFHQSQLPLRMRHGRYLARIIRSEPRVDLLGNGLVLISVVPHRTQPWVTSSRSFDAVPLGNSAGATAVISIRCPQYGQGSMRVGRCDGVV
jgi:hypothetical protein